MKKILSIIMTVAMFVALPIHSLASEEGEVVQGSQEKSGKTNVDYNMEETYTVVFPASVTFTDAEKEVERGLEVRDVALREGSSLNVNVSSQNDFKMKNGDGYIDYQLSANYVNPLKNNVTILTVNAGEPSGWVILNFATELDKSNASYAGRYTDTLTFTVSVS